MLPTCLHSFTTEYGLMTGLFVGGLAGSLTHCTTMCGPFVMAQTPASSDKCYEKIKGATLLPYHLGRTTTYVALAAMLHSVVNIAFLYMPIKGYLIAPILLLTGLMFLAQVTPRLASAFPWLSKIAITFPFRILAPFINKFLNSPAPLHRYLLGIVLGFMPCGLVLSALLTTSMAPSTGSAVMGMASFAIGTVPALVMLAFGGQSLRQYKPNLFYKIQNGAAVISGVWLCALAGFMIF